MLITNDFVVLNLTKTGSSYVREVIKSIYQNRSKRNPITYLLTKLNLRELGYLEHFTPRPWAPDKKHQHGAYYEIPDQFRDRHVVSVARDPFDRFLSQYTFQWWVRYPPFELDFLQSRFPNFPKLSIDEYLELRKLTTKRQRVKWSIAENVPVGDQTMEYIGMFFKEPFKILKGLTKEYLDSDEFLNDMADIELLRQENLNEELACFLDRMGFTPTEVSFARKHQHINISGPEDRSNRLGLTENVRQYILENEFYLHKLLKSKGIEYAGFE